MKQFWHDISVQQKADRRVEKKQDKTRIAKSRAILTRDKSYPRLLTVEKETAKQ